jgi:hypothetical protein
LLAPSLWNPSPNAKTYQFLGLHEFKTHYDFGGDDVVDEGGGLYLAGVVAEVDHFGLDDELVAGDDGVAENLPGYPNAPKSTAERMQSYLTNNAILC